ncbi:MAG: DNA polymerase III subunit beta [Gammaproteobacteria bacterium]|nr:DNA polymerase III subunit beta [Gammaproteobacteria bacterium]
MKFKIQRESILKPLNIVNGVVERRQTLPILSNVYLAIDNDNVMSLKTTDLEVELISKTLLDNAQPGEVTIPAKKLLDICRTLPESAQVEISLKNDKVLLKSGKSRFTLSTLPTSEFPGTENVTNKLQFVIAQKQFKNIIGRTQFAMAQQDVRYYLNGLMFEVGASVLRAVATDGHRLSLCDTAVSVEVKDLQSVIVPRKGVIELHRLLSDSDDEATVSISNNHIKVEMNDITFTSKLVEGRFPDYARVLPQHVDKIVYADREHLKQALTRASILSNEKYRGIRLQLTNGEIKALANNPELEEAEEVIDVVYQGADLEIGFNVNYVIDALSAIDSTEVQLGFSDSNSSCLIQPKGVDNCKYVVMPMRL